MLRRCQSKARASLALLGPTKRGFAKIVSILYDDPVDGYPAQYTRDSLPKIEHYPDQFGKPGKTTPSPKNSLPFQGVKLLGSVSGELGLREYLEKQGHQYVVTADKDGKDAELESHLADAV